MAIPTPPTGLTYEVYSNRITIFWVKNPETNISGYNIYNATTSGGGVSGYVNLNNSLIDEITRVDNVVTSSETVVQQVGAEKTTTLVETIEQVTIYSYEHTGLTEDVKQYYVITAVNDIAEESSHSIEVGVTPFTITTEDIDFPLRTQKEVALDLITVLLGREPKLDVKPGSVERQIHIDPQSREFYLAYIRLDFAMRSQSFMALRQLDDADNDRISDDVETSTKKLLLKEAYFLENDDDVQSMIDLSFDRLSSNFGVFRGQAITSNVDLLFYTDVAPTADIVIPFETEAGTIPTETEDAIVFSTLSEVTMEVANLDNYWNTVTEQYELTVAAVALIGGSAGNVNANTIVSANVAGILVTNLQPAIGGEDEESNADLADRANLAFIGLDVGTDAGYRRVVMSVPEVRDMMVVGAGHPMMQRDYDEIREKHVYGKVDIYIRGGDDIQVSENIGFLFNQSEDEEFSIDDATNMIISSTSGLPSLTDPIFRVNSVNNLSQGGAYDLLGNWRIRKNSSEMLKGIEVDVVLTTGLATFATALTTGDVVEADYDYKTQITAEVLIATATGGEVNFQTASFPIAKRTLEIYKNDVLMDESEYTFTLLNGTIQLNTGLTIGDNLKTNYKYITSITNEVLYSNATGGETTAQFANIDVLESLLIGLDGVSLELEPTNYTNASIGMLITDLIKATYRYRDSEPILLSNQPATGIVSVVGSESGTLVEDVNYEFESVDDILIEGNSSRSQRKVQIIFANGIPLGDVFENSEEITLVNNEYKELEKLGIDTASIVVTDGATIYQENIDYLIQEAESTEEVQIARSSSSTIPNGVPITVLYDYGELLTITYTMSRLVNTVQEEIEAVRNITADILVKSVLETELDFEFSVVLDPSVITEADIETVKSDITTKIVNYLDALVQGSHLAQSDIIHIIEDVDKVKSVLIPLTTMIKTDGTKVNREIINTDFILFQSSVVNSYTTGIDTLLNQTLGSNAGDGFYAIFESDRALTLVTSQNDVDTAAGQGFISSEGEIVVSTIDGDLPSAHNYTVSYIINGESGSSDIDISDLEYLAVNTLVIHVA